MFSQALMRHFILRDFASLREIKNDTVELKQRKRRQNFPHGTGGPRTVADRFFDNRGQSAKGLVIFDDLEKRVVTETVRPVRLKTYPTAANAAGFDDDSSLRIGQGHPADVMGHATFPRHIG